MRDWHKRENNCLAADEKSTDWKSRGGFLTTIRRTVCMMLNPWFSPWIRSISTLLFFYQFKFLLIFFTPFFFFFFFFVKLKFIFHSHQSGMIIGWEKFTNIRIKQLFVIDRGELAWVISWIIDHQFNQFAFVDGWVTVVYRMSVLNLVELHPIAILRELIAVCVVISSDWSKQNKNEKFCSEMNFYCLVFTPELVLTPEHRVTIKFGNKTDWKYSDIDTIIITLIEIHSKNCYLTSKFGCAHLAAFSTCSICSF